jgi:predicted nucleic acid-binding protein
MPTQFVIDNSVVMTWCFEDQTTKYAESVLNRLETSEAFAPGIWPLEVGNVLLIAERKNILSNSDVVRFLSLLQSLPIYVEQESTARMLMEIVGLAREYRLSTYDAAYLDLAMRRGLPLATQDKALAGAAKKCGIELF